jgi:hypothetical protein
MNDHDGGMAAAEQDNAAGVPSCCVDLTVRIPGRRRDTHDGPAAAAASIRRRFGFEAASTALAGNGGHSSDHRSKARRQLIFGSGKL